MSQQPRADKYDDNIRGPLDLSDPVKRGGSENRLGSVAHGMWANPSDISRTTLCFFRLHFGRRPTWHASSFFSLRGEGGLGHTLLLLVLRKLAP